MSRNPLVLPILLTIILLSGCTSLDTLRFSAEASLDAMKSSMDKKMKAKPAEGTGFVPMQQLAKNPSLPFDKAWIKQGVDWNRYRTIYIAPVNTDYLMRANWWQESIRANQMQQDVQNMATFMRTQFIMAFQNDSHHRLRVVMSPERGSLTLAMALTELIPSKVLLNAVKIAGPYGSGLAAAALERGTEAQSTVAFEARVKDTDTGQTVAMFADREYAPVRPIDLKGFTWYGNAEDIVKQWAKEFVEVANRRPGEIIKPASKFSLLPW
jgi:Protein of unknown function (DUF3313)